MVKTHPQSRFSLLSLEQLRDSKDVILQAEKTDTVFSDSKHPCYLCEVATQLAYNSSKHTVDALVSEIARVNAENRKLLTKIQRLGKEIADDSDR
jgi:hypothetical protein